MIIIHTSLFFIYGKALYSRDRISEIKRLSETYQKNRPLHCRLYTVFYKGNIYRKGKNETHHHGYLHHEPEFSRVARRTSASKQHEYDKRHPCVHAYLPRGERKEIGFDGSFKNSHSLHRRIHLPDCGILEADTYK